MKHFILLVAFFSVTSAANILGVFPLPSESHHILGSILMGNLAKRGHNVTYITPYKRDIIGLNVTTLVIEEVLKFKEEKLQQHTRPALSLTDRLERAIGLKGIHKVIMESPTIQWFIKSESKFDLMIIIGNDVTLGFGHHFDVPIMIFSPIGGVSLVGDRFGNSNPIAYVPSVYVPYSDDMNFLERLENTIVTLIFKVVQKVVDYFINDAVQEYFPGAPHLNEIQNRVQMLLVNSHISTETARPYVPAMVQIGGFHMQDPEPLPEELKKILDEAPNGVIYFSFGTNIKVSKLDEDKLDVFMNSLGRLPLKVLLKSDTPTLPNKPDNVEIRSWFPQRGILAHPNVKGFIGHGGYGGVTETLFYGVPMICIPFFFDQPQHCTTAEKDGYGINLPIDQLTSETFDKALQKVIYDKTFITKTKLKSELYRDQEMNPMDKAAYWVNHVIKHKGAKHLRVKALDLAWYQYYLLDVIAIILVAFVIIIAISLYILRCCFNRFCRRHQKIKTN